MAISGTKSRIVWLRETNYGVDLGVGYLGIGQLQGDPALSLDNKLFTAHAAGRINPRDILTGACDIEVRFDYFIQNGGQLVASIGDFDTTSPILNVAAYEHYGTTEDSTSVEATPVEYECNSYSLHMGGDTAATDYNIALAGCKTNSVTISFGLDEPMRASVTAFAKKALASNVVQTVTELTEGPYMHTSNSVLNVNDVATYDVTSLSVTLSNNLQRVYATASAATDTRLITDLLQGTRTITGTVDLNFNDDTELELFLDSTAAGTHPSDFDVAQFDIDLTVSNGLAATLVTYRGIKVDIRDMKFGTHERSFPQSGGPITERFSFTAKKLDIHYYDATNADLW